MVEPSMEEPRARGVSLWLVPAGEERDRLAALVARLAASLGTRPFAPHVTLLPGLEGPEKRVLATAASVAASIRPFQVRLVSIEGREEHFRCLIARARADEPLLCAHAAASRAFGREPEPAFLPHMSLVYGTLAPAVTARLAAELAAEATVSFEVVSLHVWRTEGPVDDWREIGAFGLPAS